MKKMSASNESWRIIALSFYIRSTGNGDCYSDIKMIIRIIILLFINKLDN